jgi:DNA-directed RNA polymerase subunit RPC12/RpoP
VITFECPACQKPLRVNDDAAGKKTACPGCGQRILIPPPVDRTKTVLAKPIVEETVPVVSKVAVSCPGCGRAIMITPAEMMLQLECSQCDTRFSPSGPPARQPQRGDDDEDDEEDDRPTRRRRLSRGFRCPYCNSDAPPYMKSKTSTTGWVVFCVLLLGCFPLSVIGLFITESHRECSDCGVRIG